MRKIAIVTALALLTSPASAGSFSCIHTGMLTTCNWGGGSGIPRIIHVPQPQSDEDRAETQARVEKWEAFCKPAPTIDRYGVTRYVYTHDGCDLGRSQ